tara:strand:- start:1307 stop:1585 length:279 start_codon:yes stop_codon:yes gene_type:complete
MSARGIKSGDSSRRKMKANSSQQSIRSGKRRKNPKFNGPSRFNSNSSMSNQNVNQSMNFNYLKNVRPVEQSFDGVGQVDLQRPTGPEHDPST